ncbi:carboxymuconolactone decarboxylase family protein [Actinoplanes sp. CA-142083]|uniref:carboxymuconolactone decarboxylase family protein n=1 Tax=Actinoplanes sp. CA-142083 TaxID=3239903 RepID=UPI003D8AE159
MTARLPGLRPGDLSPAQLSVYEAIAGGPRANGPFALVDENGALHGPFNAMLLQPELGAALQALGGAIRYRTALDARAREIATLTVARAWDSAFERHAHEAVARSIGMSEAEVTALRTGEASVFTDPRERLIFDLSTALAARQDLTDDEYAAAVGVLGQPAVFELTTLVGYYATLALQLRVFRVQVPGVTEGG